MVALMRFTRDICRLLGLGSEGPSAPRQEEIECGAATPDHNDDVTLSQEQDILSGEEGLSEEEKIKCRAERRRAKRKRRRERKKLEQAKKSENDEQDGEDEDGGAESELEESESEEEEEEDEEVEKEEQKEEKPAISRCKDAPVPPVVPPGTRAPQKAPTTPSEEEPEWDVSSAFFANAASHIRPKGWTKPGRKSKENKENEARTREVNADAVTKRSASLTEKGIKLVQEGQYSQAVSMFTEAIRYDPKDYRFFGNRSYCYSCLEKYPQALSDAERSIQLASDWPKGHFRKGSALIGMKRYSEAEKAMEQVLKLDKDCEEAVNDLFNCKVLQLMELGYEEMQSVLLLERYSTIQTVLASPEAARVVSQDSSLVQPGSPGPSLWVGNVTAELTEKHLWDLFKMYGEIDSIRVLHERFCAFVNFKNANMASRAMEKLNGYSIENTRLVVRYPDRRTQRVLPVPLKTSPPITQQVGAVGPRRRGPVNGDECYFWRTTGCHFGEKCRYKHIPEQLGKDRKPWQP